MYTFTYKIVLTISFLYFFGIYMCFLDNMSFCVTVEELHVHQ